jgi:hypothetical protein
MVELVPYSEPRLAAPARGSVRRLHCSPNVSVRLSNGEKRGLLPKHQYGDAQNRTLPNMNYAAFVNRAAREFDWYESNGAEGNEGKVKMGRPGLPHTIEELRKVVDDDCCYAQKCAGAN